MEAKAIIYVSNNPRGNILTINEAEDWVDGDQQDELKESVLAALRLSRFKGKCMLKGDMLDALGIWHDSADNVLVIDISGGLNSIKEFAEHLAKANNQDVVLVFFRHRSERDLHLSLEFGRNISVENLVKSITKAGFTGGLTIIMPLRGYGNEARLIYPNSKKTMEKFRRLIDILDDDEVFYSVRYVPGEQFSAPGGVSKWDMQSTK